MKRAASKVAPSSAPKKSGHVKRRHLPVIQPESQPPQLEPPRPKDWRPKHPGYSPEIVRDSDVDVEPRELAEVPLDDNRRAQWLAYRAARTLAGTAPDPIPAPRTRADCPPDRAERGCGAYSCRHNLRLITERAGRPGLAACPRGPRGHTIPTPGDLGAREMDVDPAWLRHPLPPSCALDVADAGRHDNLELAAAFGRHRTLTAKLVRRAARSFIANGGTFEGLLELMGEGEKPISNLAQAIDTLGFRRTPNVHRRTADNSESKDPEENPGDH